MSGYCIIYVYLFYSLSAGHSFSGSHPLLSPTVGFQGKSADPLSLQRRSSVTAGSVHTKEQWNIIEFFFFILTL